MAKISIGRVTAILLFSSLIAGAIFCLQRLAQDISIRKYFSQPEELHYEITFIASYLFIILFVLRYGYYLATNKVTWETIKGDFVYLLNRKYFSKTQWMINLLLFWLALIGFIYSLAISATKGNL